MILWLLEFCPHCSPRLAEWLIKYLHERATQMTATSQMLRKDMFEKVLLTTFY